MTRAKICDLCTLAPNNLTDKTCEVLSASLPGSSSVSVCLQAVPACLCAGGHRHRALRALSQGRSLRPAAREAFCLRARCNGRDGLTGPPRLRYGRLRDVHARPRRAAGGLDAQEVHRRSGGGHGAERRPRVGARRGRAGAACLREGHPRGRLRRRPYRQHDPARRPRDRRRGHGEPVVHDGRVAPRAQDAGQLCLCRNGRGGGRVPHHGRKDHGRWPL